LNRIPLMTPTITKPGIFANSLFIQMNQGRSAEPLSVSLSEASWPSAAISAFVTESGRMAFPAVTPRSHAARETGVTPNSRGQTGAVFQNEIPPSAQKIRHEIPPGSLRHGRPRLSTSPPRRYWQAGELPKRYRRSQREKESLWRLPPRARRFVTGGFLEGFRGARVGGTGRPRSKVVSEGVAADERNRKGLWVFEGHSNSISGRWTSFWSRHLKCWDHWDCRAPETHRRAWVGD
jgi:hypothetical protein